ncbi:hypothetical protein N780_00865 [Pontibacillus chungwhensis BH030062]|uniref:Uncharacterized protein n=1 Tax=Pontibacillus chungwhensis BH030062 TaxID=1385513 RepID=A0A0A2V0R9_9BACI|nr:hypothetical protein [Pontibacillus chungwhensis]KGP92361.1 hypothetical protein N780_00865 [Pontibacillus chungwhensis BH030062]
MRFKVIAYYNQMTKITFQSTDNQDLVFNDFGAAKRFVNALKELGSYERYSFQIVSMDQELMLPSSTSSPHEKKYLYSY